jgi:hypothetical protein
MSNYTDNTTEVSNVKQTENCLFYRDNSKSLKFSPNYTHFANCIII